MGGPGKTRAVVYHLLHVIVILIGCLLAALNWSTDPRIAAFFFAVGTSLIATGAAGIVLSLYVSREPFRLELVNEADIAGLLRLLPYRSTKIKDEYDKRIHRAKQIDILGIGLSAFREDYREEISHIAKRAKVRVLLLDPEAPGDSFSFAAQKDTEERNPPGQSASDIQAFINEFAQLRKKGKFEIRLYGSMPGINIFRADDEAFWGPYVVGSASRNLPSMIVRRGGYLFTMLTEHFEQVWQQAREP
jgi:hypothetical protein